MQTTHSSTLIDRAASKWWFYLLLTILFFLPAYTAQPFNQQETPELVIEVLSHSLIYKAAFVFPLFKLVPLAVIVLVLVRPRQFTRIFYAYVALNLLVCAIFQNMAYTPAYGFALLTGNIVVYTFTALIFAWAALSAQEPLQFERRTWWRYWVVLLALLAFWFPVKTDLASPAPDFSLARLLLNEAGLTICMMLPVYLAILTLASSSLDPPLLRIVGFIGAITGLLNVAQFFMNPSYGWWLGIVHLPLLFIATYSFTLSLRYHSLGKNPDRLLPRES